MSRASDGEVWRRLVDNRLDDADAARLDRLVTDALARQSAALSQAIDGGLDHIPRLLRGPVRKALFR